MPFPCQQCRSVRVNGRPIHETGCPDAWRDQPKACFVCGYTFMRTERYQSTCPDCAADAVEDYVADGLGENIDHCPSDNT